MKVYVIGPDNYANWINDAELVDSIEDAEIVIFTGGEDVDPSLYEMERHSSTVSNLERDYREKEIFEKINPKTQMCIGICRGSQFLTVMNGGLLIQNVSDHCLNRTHDILVRKSLDSPAQLTVAITSTHHQMMYPSNIPDDHYKILGVSKEYSNYYEGIPYEVYTEPEIVFYNVPDKPLCLAIQGHPEMMRKECAVNQLLNIYIKLCLNCLH